MEDKAAGCWPDCSHKPQRSMAREPTKLQRSRSGMKSVSVYLSPEKRRKVKVLAAAMDTTVNALMRRAVELVLAEYKGKPRKHVGRISRRRNPP
jgi:16S rRNA U516 pseudouridylate synthase RsuA-like enzyme